MPGEKFFFDKLEKNIANMGLDKLLDYLRFKFTGIPSENPIRFLQENLWLFSYSGVKI